MPCRARTTSAPAAGRSTYGGGMREPFFVRWLPRALVAVAALSLLATLSTGFPRVRHVLDTILFWLVPLPILDVVSIVVITLIAIALRRRKRLAWLALVGITVVTLVGYLLVLASFTFSQGSPFDLVWQDWALLLVNFTVTSALLAGLVLHRRHYAVRTAPGDWRRALLVLVVGLLLTLAVAIVAIWLDPTVTSRQLREVLMGALGAAERLGPHWLRLLIGSLATLSFLAATWVLLRAQRAEARMSVEEELPVRRLATVAPPDSLGYFATRRDRTAFFTPDGAITYRVELGVAIAGGDPVGEARHWVATAEAFGRHAAAFGWVPAVMAASEDGAKAYAEAGLEVLHIGDEAVLSTETFSLAQLPDVRRAVRRLTDLGYTTQVRRHHDISAEELERLTVLAEQWRGEEERGFSMALGRPFGDPSDGSCVMVLAHFPRDHVFAGQVAGLLSFVPWWGTEPRST